MRRNRALTGHSEAMGPFGPAQGIPKAERRKEKLKAFGISVGIIFAGASLTALTGIPSFSVLGLIAVGIFLARRAEVDLRPALFFAMLAFYLAGSLATSQKTAKPARESFKQANVANNAASAGLASLPVDAVKALVAELVGSGEEQPKIKAAEK